MNLGTSQQNLLKIALGLKIGYQLHSSSQGMPKAFLNCHSGQVAFQRLYINKQFRKFQSIPTVVTRGQHTQYTFLCVISSHQSVSLHCQIINVYSTECMPCLSYGSGVTHYFTGFPKASLFLLSVSQRPKLRTTFCNNIFLPSVSKNMQCSY